MKTDGLRVLGPLHRWLGVAGVVVFVLSGQYMDIVWNHLRDMPDGPRLAFRSIHIYLLFAALLNVSVGSYFAPRAAFGPRLGQLVGSALLLFALALMGAAFWLEAPPGGLERPLARLGIESSLAGALLHLTAGRFRAAGAEPG